MIEVRIKNMDLKSAIELFDKLPLKGKQSRHRSKLLKIMQPAYKELNEQEVANIREHCNLDEDGNPKMLNDNTIWDLKDIPAFVRDRDELFQEELVITGPDKEEMLKTIGRVLDECDIEFSGAEADFYDTLCEQFESQEEIIEDTQ